jgi:hypothetical protein
MEDIRIINEVMPVIQINFDQIKAELSETLKIYKNIVVTEETLPGCKQTQKELAGIRIKLDTYRKDKKKELSKPIEAFENQCKELIALIEQAEAPIKDGIKVFDDQKREEKRLVAVKLIGIVIDEIGLNEKYGARLDVSEKYCNLTAKESDVKSDLEARAMALKVEQDREAELMEIIQDSIDTENKRIESKLKFEDFKRLIDRGVPTKDILAEVKASADRIFRAEHPEPKPEVKPEPAPEPIQEPEINHAEQVIKEAEETTYYATYRITGKKNDLLAVSQFLKDNGLTYKVIEQGEI